MKARCEINMTPRSDEDQEYVVTEQRTLKPMSEVKFSGLYTEVAYVNDSKYTLYVGFSDGTIRKLEPCENPAIQTNKVLIHVRIVTDTAPCERPKEGFLVNTITVDVGKVIRKGYVYIDSLDVCICLVEKNMVRFHKKCDKYIERQIQEKVKAALKSQKTAPLQILGNDPSGMIEDVYISAGKSSFLFFGSITNDTEAPSYLTIRVRTENGAYVDYDVDMDQLFREDGVFELVDSLLNLSLAVAASKTEINRWLKKQQDKVEETITLKEHKKLIATEQRKYEEYKRVAEEAKLREKLQKERELDEIKKETEYAKLRNEYAKAQHESEKLRGDFILNREKTTASQLTEVLKLFGAVMGVATFVITYLGKTPK